MSRKALVLIATVLALASPASPAASVVVTIETAIAIGINKYATHRLEYATADAVAFGRLFKKPVVLLDETATRERILSELAALGKAMTQEAAQRSSTTGARVIVNHRLFFFFSGHSVSAANEYYLVPQDVRVDPSSNSGLISAADLMAALSLIPANQVVVAIDASHSQKLYERVLALRRGDRTVADLTGRRLTLITTDNSSENHQLRHGVLTAALLRSAEEKMPFEVGAPYWTWKLSEGKARAWVYVDVPLMPESASRGLTLTAPSPPAPAAGAGRRDYALLIGSNTYQHFPELSNPIPDVRAIGQELRENYGFDVEILENATEAQIDAAFRRAKQRTYGEHDQFLFFFAGHGDYDEVHNSGFLVASDSYPQGRGDTVRINPFSHANVYHIIKNMTNVAHKLVVLDSCFSGAFDPKMSPGGARSDPYQKITRDELITRKLKLAVNKWITSGSREYVPDGVPGRHSPFARQVLEALRSYGGETGVLTTSALLSSVQQLRVQPRYGEFPDSDAGGEFLFITKKAAVAAVLAQR